MNKKGRRQMQYDNKDNTIQGTFEDLYETEVSSTDYVFVVSGDGALKSVFCPDLADINSEVPMTINDILKVFGIKDIGGQPVLH